jgi:hypothetical protein
LDVEKSFCFVLLTKRCFSDVENEVFLLHNKFVFDVKQEIACVMLKPKIFFYVKEKAVFCHFNIRSIA